MPKLPKCSTILCYHLDCIYEVCNSMGIFLIILCTCIGCTCLAVCIMLPSRMYCVGTKYVSEINWCHCDVQECSTVLLKTCGHGEIIFTLSNNILFSFFTSILSLLKHKYMGTAIGRCPRPSSDTTVVYS